jgi:mannosylglucosylglycerate synthase
MVKEAKKRIGFISTRFSGTDGVSLEVRKWVQILNNLGHSCFFFAGESEWSPERSMVVPEAHFNHATIQQLNKDLFDNYIRSPETSSTVEVFKNLLKRRLRDFIKQFNINLIIVENALAIPMNVPLGLAITELIAETSIPTIAHHHDFSWERPRFAVNAADDYLHAAFPATLRSITHVVINSFAQRQLALRKGVSATIVPNVMDFDSVPPMSDNYADDLRERLDISQEEFFILQPTRIVPRKRIERAIDLSRRLDLPNTLVISHASGDEGSEYEHFLEEYIALLGASVRFAEDVFGMKREKGRKGRKIYALADAYQTANLVTYPSTVEGFGNAFLEALYFQRPIVMSTYEIYRIDIKPKGFQIIEFDDFVTSKTVQKARDILLNPGLSREISEANYLVARQHYSFTILEKLLTALISQSASV